MHAWPQQVQGFVASLPLGCGAASAAEVEAAVAARLVEAECSKAQLHQRLQKWCVLTAEVSRPITLHEAHTCLAQHRALPPQPA